MSYTLGQAAKATGKSKSTLQAAIKKGRISATQNESGQYHIDPAELHRVYPPASSIEPQTEQNLPLRLVEKEAEIKALQARLEALSELKQRLEGECEDLREDRNYWRLQARALPPPETAAPKAEDVPPPKKGFFRRLFGG